MRTVLLALLLLAPALDAAEPPHVVTARKFLLAFDREDTGRMAILAAQPARTTSYALVAFSLLESREYEAAKQLVNLRIGAPEAGGLKRLVDGYIAGARASEVQRVGWQKAEGVLRQGDPARAIQILDAAGKAPDGTITAARLAWTRARALAARKDVEASAAAFAECARVARTTGWLQRAAAAEQNRLLVLRGNAAQAEQAMVAAGNLIEDARMLDDAAKEYNARIARAELLLKANKPKEARVDYRAALDRARGLGKPELEGQLLSNIAFVLHVVEGQPRRARRFYTEALEAIQRTGDAGSIAKARLNLARVLTDIGDYEAALAEADAVPAEAPAIMQRATRAQRAYILRQQGRLDASRDAYAKLLASAKTEAEKSALALELGELQLLRGDFYAARAQFRSAAVTGRFGGRALAGQATAEGGLRRKAECRALFAQARDAAPNDVARGRILMQWVALERAFGAIDRALALTQQAQALLARKDSGDYGNAAVTWVVRGDLALLDGQLEVALDALGKASTFFYQLRDPGRAVPAYAREIYVLLQIKTQQALEDIKQRRSVLLHMAAGSGSNRLKSMAASTDGLYLAMVGRQEEATERLDEAARLGRETDGIEETANALVNRALVSGAEGYPFAREALKLLDGQPDRDPGLHPPVIGERPDDADAVALHTYMQTEAPDPAVVLELVERIRMRRVRLALGGRDAILAQRLEEAEFRRYVDVRTRLREARRSGENETAALRAFQEVAATYAAQAPLAFGRAPELSTVSSVLRFDELLVLVVDDAYGRTLLAIDRQRAVARRFEADKHWAALADMLEGKKRVLVAPDGFLAMAPQKGFEIQFIDSAAGLVAGRRREPVRPSSVDRPEGPVRIDLRHPAATDAWPAKPARVRLALLDRTAVRAGTQSDALAALAAARLRSGADYVLISLSGKTDSRLIDRFLADFQKDRSDPVAIWASVRAWAQGHDELKDPSIWGSLVLWG
ncbi:MAG: tetratricopeptide repeat protein, partial [Planctomycetota bacterium]